MTNEKTALMQALAAFVSKRPGLEFRDYGDITAYRADARKIARDLKDYRELERYVLVHDCITAQHIVDASKSAFSGRLTIDMTVQGLPEVKYCTGQYFPTEYRAAACAVLAAAIWADMRNYMPDDVTLAVTNSNLGTWLRAQMKARFSSGVYKRWFE